jgi:uncharacterized oligopeptide transporter (OPT) family protein
MTSPHTAPETAFTPYVPPTESPKEFTPGAIILGVLLGLVFAASSIYLALKVSLTVSASIPIAVLSITIFRYVSKVFGARPATILQNNLVQTTGSARRALSGAAPAQSDHQGAWKSQVSRGHGLRAGAHRR